MKKRTMELLNKARKQTEKASNLIDIRQLPKQEVFINNTHPCKKHLKQQPMSLEEWRRGRLGGDNTGLISQEPFRCCKRLGKKAQCQLLEVTSLEAEASLEVLKRRRRMQAMEMSKKPQDRGLGQEKAVFLSREKVKPSSHDMHLSTAESSFHTLHRWPPLVPRKYLFYTAVSDCLALFAPTILVLPGITQLGPSTGMLVSQAVLS